MKQQNVIKEEVPQIYNILYKKNPNRKVTFNAITIRNRRFRYTLEAPFDLKNQKRKELFISNEKLDICRARKEALNILLKFR